MFELFSNIYFVVYNLYYIGQIDDLSIRARLRNWDGGRTIESLDPPKDDLKMVLKKS
jgi:hypothetical protein